VLYEIFANQLAYCDIVIDNEDMGFHLGGEGEEWARGILTPEPVES
jgi:hypothetical protein